MYVQIQKPNSFPAGMGGLLESPHAHVLEQCRLERRGEYLVGHSYHAAHFDVIQH